MSLREIVLGKLGTEQKIYLAIAFIVNFIILFFILFGEGEQEVSFFSKILAVIIYIPYSFLTGKYISAFYKLVTPQRQWLTKSSFAHHASKIFGLGLSAGILIFIYSLLLV
tara:strand:- start:1 stop:333 length:333 start_codon:yes stop_codon:yes gene_type:complete